MKRRVFAGALFGALLLFVAPVSAQFPACPSCGRYHAPNGVHGRQVASGVYNALSMLNRQRAAYGNLAPYLSDPYLQRLAEQRVLMVGRGGRFNGHPGGLPGGVGEGVGMSPRSNPSAVVACMTYRRDYRRAGCAMWVYRGRTYFCLLVAR